MMNTIFISIIVFFLALISLSVVGVIAQRIDRQQEIEEENELKQYQQQLASIRQEIEQAKQEREFSAFDNHVSLTNGEITVLNIYEESNIKIPVDIIEELTANRNHLTSEKMIFDYIENQRQYWKLENTKKPYRRVK